MAINQIDSQALGKFLQVVFTNGIMNQMSQYYQEWEYIKKIRVDNGGERSRRFFYRSSNGPAAVQSVAIASPGSYPTASQSTVGEAEAIYKELAATIELEANLWRRAQKSPAKYAEPLAEEILAKSDASKRLMCQMFFNDGCGVIGIPSAVSISSGKLLVTLNTSNTTRGFVGFCEYGDLLIHKVAAGTAPTDPTLSAGTHSYFRVDNVDRVNNQITLASITTDGTVGTITVAGLAATDVLYRKGQVTFVNVGSVSGEYNTQTEAITGLESLTASDGRTVHGITMSGITGGSRYDAGANPLDTTYVQKAMSLCKVRVGRGKFSYKQMLMAPEALDALIESREADRRFTSMEDAKRGTKIFGYQHENDFMEAVTSEFCPKNRIYMIPEAKNGQKVLEFYGTDFEPVRPAGQGSEFMLKPNSSGHDRYIRSYLEAHGVIVCKQPAAICVVHDFTV